MKMIFKDAQLNAVLRRFYGDHRAWIDNDLVPPMSFSLHHDELDDDVDYAMSMIAQGNAMDDDDFIIGGLYSLLSTVLRATTAMGLEPDEMVSRGRKLISEMSQRLSSPITVEDDTIEFLVGLSQMCGYDAEVRSRTLGGLKEIVFSRDDGEKLIAQNGDRVRVDPHGRLIPA